MTKNNLNSISNGIKAKEKAAFLSAPDLKYEFHQEKQVSFVEYIYACFLSIDVKA